MILVLWPSCRPDTALKMAQLWVSRCVNERNVYFYFGINSDCVSFPAELDNRLGMVTSSGACNSDVILTGTVKGATHSATVLTKKIAAGYRNDIVVLASDDFEAPQNWDANLTAQFDGFNGMLIADDRVGTNIIAIPICTVGYLWQLGGILYHPEYFHFYSDQELYDNCHEIGNVRDIRGKTDLVFRHKHWSFQGRDRDHFDERNSSNWAKDKATYERRKVLPLAEKLKLPEGWLK